MGLTNYDIIYLMTNVFATYIVFKFMNIFFDRNEANRKKELTSYFLYFLIIGVIFITFDTPILNLITNLILFFLLTLNYPSTNKHRIIAIIYIYAILMTTETVTVLIFSVLKINDSTKGVDMELILALIVSKILSYIIVLVLANFKMLKANINISPLHWIAVFIIPISTLFSTAIFTLEKNQTDSLQVFLSIAFLFLINIFVFYLYEILLKSYEEKGERQLLKQQNNAYIQQLDIMTRSQQNLAIARHDMKSHLSALWGLIEKEENLSALNYLQNTLKALDVIDEYAKSGNVGIDSILNYKIQTAIGQKIDVDLILQVPEKLNIQPYDLVAIIGNIFDNTIEAVLKSEKKRKIDINISFNRNVLYIDISNPFHGDLVYKGNNLVTTHNIENRGFGLESVKRSIDKYNGSMNIQHDNNIFNLNILLYNSL